MENHENPYIILTDNLDRHPSFFVIHLYFYGLCQALATSLYILLDRDLLFFNVSNIFACQDNLSTIKMSMVLGCLSNVIGCIL